MALLLPHPIGAPSTELAGYPAQGQQQPMAKLRHDSDPLPFWEPTTPLFRVRVAFDDVDDPHIVIECASSRQGKLDLIADMLPTDQFVAAWPGRTRTDCFDVTERVRREYDRQFAPAALQQPMEAVDDIPFE